MRACDPVREENRLTNANYLFVVSNERIFHNMNHRVIWEVGDGVWVYGDQITIIAGGQERQNQS